MCVIIHMALIVGVLDLLGYKRTKARSIAPGLCGYEEKNLFRSLLRFKRSLGLLDQPRKARRVLDGDIREDLSIQLDPSLLQSIDQQ